MRSIASVPTQRPARYGKQLVSHMGRKIKGLWDGESGQLDFNGGGDVRLSSQDDSLTLELSCEESEVDRLEYIVGVHLARFGSKDGLSVAWKREDGTEGTVQGPYSEADMQAFAEAKKARLAAQAAEKAEEATAAEGAPTAKSA